MDRAGPVAGHGAIAFDPDCPFCRLAAGYGGEVKTRLWYYEHGVVIVVSDLEPKHWAARLLAVPAVHVACGEEDVATRLVVCDALDEARRLFVEETGFMLAERDLVRHTFTAHFHAQDCYQYGRWSDDRPG